MSNHAELDPYAVLGVDRHASGEDIRGAFRKLSKTLHPDVAGDASKARFQEIQWAFSLLSDVKARDEYDRTGRVGQKENDLHDKMLHAVNALMEAVIEQEEEEDTTDIIAKVKSTIANAVPVLRKELKAAKRKLKKAKTIMRRMKKRGGGPDLLKNMLERRCARAENAVKAQEEALQLNEAMQKFFADYDYELDEQPGFGRPPLPPFVSRGARPGAPGVFIGRRMPDIPDDPSDIT